MNKVPPKSKALTGYQRKQQETEQIAVDTSARQSNSPVEFFLLTTDVQDTPLTNSDASTFLRGAILSLLSAISFSSLKTFSGTAAVIKHLTIIQDSDTDPHFFKI